MSYNHLWDNGAGRCKLCGVRSSESLGSCVDPLGYAIRLANSLREKHFPDVPQWQPLPDLYGVLSQIDNMTTALVREPTTPASGGAQEPADDAREAAIRLIQVARSTHGNVMQRFGIREAGQYFTGLNLACDDLEAALSASKCMRAASPHGGGR